MRRHDQNIKLTHLVLVREVVGIKGLRREKPPEESNQQGFEGELTHTQIHNRNTHGMRSREQQKNLCAF